MYPELFSIGPFTIHTFGLMMALGFVSAGIVAHFEFKRKGMNPEYVYWLTLGAAVGGLLGSKIHYLLLHLDELGDDPLASAFSGAGLVWYGGFIGGFLAAVVLCRLFKLSIPMVLDAGAPSMALGYAFGRMGCFLNGDDYGMPSTLPWAMEFPEGSPATPAGVSVQPTQLYESFAALAMFFILLYLRPRLKSNWAMFCAFLVMAGVERFLVEFVRFHTGDLPGVVRDGQLQQQLLALVTAIVAGIVLYRIQKRAHAR